MLTLTFYVLWLIARLQLGHALTFGAKARGPLITSGFYAIVRNPIYVFGTLALSNYVILIHRPTYLIPIALLLVPVQCIRALQEQRELKRRFDDRYDKYAIKVWF